MIKIILIDPNYAPVVAPIRTFLFLKIKGWQKRGAKVTFICSTEAKKFYQTHLKDIDFITFPFTWRSKARWTAPFEYIRANFLAFPLLFKVRGKFDIVYSLSSTLDIIFFPWLLKFIDHKIRWFAVMDNLVPKPSERPGNYILKLIPYLAFLVSNILLKRTDGIFVVTNLLKRYYEKRGINVIKTGTGNGLDIDSFKKQITPNTLKFSALFGGRLHPAKGIFDLVAITKIIVKTDNKFTLGVMGEGEEKVRASFVDEIKSANLTKNIFLLGHKNATERWDLYRSSDFFLFPSYAEGCPQVVLEAFAANRLVIAYDLPEYRDAFEKYINKHELILFKKGDFDGISKYILSIKNKKFHFQNNLNDYSWEKIVNNEWESFVKVLQ